MDVLVVSEGAAVFVLLFPKVNCDRVALLFFLLLGEALSSPTKDTRPPPREEGLRPLVADNGVEEDSNTPPAKLLLRR